MHPAWLVPPDATPELVPSTHTAMWDPATLDLPGGGSGHGVPSSWACGCCQGALSRTAREPSSPPRVNVHLHWPLPGHPARDTVGGDANSLPWFMGVQDVPPPAKPGLARCWDGWAGVPLQPGAVWLMAITSFATQPPPGPGSGLPSREPRGCGGALVLGSTGRSCLCCSLQHDCCNGCSNCQHLSGGCGSMCPLLWERQAGLMNYSRVSQGPWESWGLVGLGGCWRSKPLAEASSCLRHCWRSSCKPGRAAVFRCVPFALMPPSPKQPAWP